MKKLSIIDTHTGGEPTRVLFDVETPQGITSARERLVWLREQADWIRRSVLLEPRGSESMVGAVLGPPADPANLASVVFFNNAGYLGMCGHGLLGVIEALRYRDQLPPSTHKIETPVGDVKIVLHADRSASFENVPSYRYRAAVTIEVADQKHSSERVSGDIAFGGNWFFLTPVDSIDFSQIDAMTRHCWSIRESLRQQGITGAGAAEIDHIELFTPLASAAEAGKPSSIRGARNFVLCPGGHYDRSPCGTGTSAKLACLAADKELAPGEVWTQESVIGSRFTASYQTTDRGILATITGRAFVSGETTCLFDPDDRFRFGINADTMATAPHPNAQQEMIG